MKAILLFVACSLFVVLQAQICTLSTDDCASCTGSCSFCEGPNSTNNNAFYLCVPPFVCTANGGTVVALCADTTPSNLTTQADFMCAHGSNVNGTETIIAAEDTRVYVSTTRVDIYAHYVAFAGITSTSNPPLLGFQYFAINGGGNPLVNGSFVVQNVDGLGAFWTTLFAIEFYPGPNDGGAFNNNTATFISSYNFTQYTVGPCSTTISNGITTYSIVFTDPNEWIITCRIADAPTKDSNLNPISPVNAKCDLTFGNYPYVKNDTRLGIFAIFVIGGFSSHVSVSPTVKPCASDTTSFCFVSESSSYAGKFAYVKTLKSGKSVVASGINFYAAAAGQFSVPSGPSSLGNANGTLTVSSTAFESASLIVFSFDHPAAGDVWDPTLEMNTKSALDPTASSIHKSSSTTVTYSLLLIIATLLIFL